MYLKVITRNVWPTVPYYKEKLRLRKNHDGCTSKMSDTSFCVKPITRYVWRCLIKQLNLCVYVRLNL